MREEQRKFSSFYSVPEVTSKEFQTQGFPDQENTAVKQLWYYFFCLVCKVSKDQCTPAVGVTKEECSIQGRKDPIQLEYLFTN